MNELHLKEGNYYIFANDDHRAEVSYGNSPGGTNAFKLRFNGKYIKITKTFRPVEKKIGELIAEHNLRYLE